MNLYATDKEYKERFDYFLEEVKNDEGNKLDEPTRYLAILSVLMGNQGICAYEEVLEKALDVLSPVQVKEMVYQATDYLGYGRIWVSPVNPLLPSVRNQFQQPSYLPVLPVPPLLPVGIGWFRLFANLPGQKEADVPRPQIHGDSGQICFLVGKL